MARPRSRWLEVLLLVAVVAIAVPLIVVGSMALRARGDMPIPVSSPSPEAQICTSCWAGDTPDPRVAGETVVANGVQVLEVGLVGGYYSPNVFTVQAGLPVSVVFTGSAEGCLAHPEFPELRVKADMSSGKATVDLGRLSPGTYSFTCSMGVNEGKITVR